MAIADEDVAQVRAATDLAALIGEHTALKRVGRRYVGLCPFHAERSPSFSVNAEEGLYYCFGCQASGDAISFVRATEGCDFVDAVERLAGRAGITLRETDDPAAARERGRRQELLAVMDAAANLYHEHLLAHPAAAAARQYLRSRGYDGEVVRQFKLGFAAPGGDMLVRALRRPPALLREAGLVFETAQGAIRDSYRERIIFPIYDASGRAIALGGRVLPETSRKLRGDPGPKYRNSPESPIYKKRRTLYGLNWAKGDVARRDEVVICEGYTDVIGFFRAGVPRAVATCGTSLTEDHVRLLSRFAKRIVLAFDADGAGQNAAARLYEWERRHELELRVARLPPGSDPADLAGRDPAALAAAIRDARPYLGFAVERALDAADLSIPEGRARAAETALAVIAEHPNELVRDEYLLVVADRTRQDADRLRPLLARQRAKGVSAPAPTDRRAHLEAGARGKDEPPPFDDDGRYDDDTADEPGGPSAPGANRRSAGSGPRARGGGGRDPEGPRPGRNALLLAVHRPAEVAELLDAACFVDPLQRGAFEALGSASHLAEAIAIATPEAGELLSRLANSDGADELDVGGTVVQLVRSAAEAALRGLMAELRERQRSEPEAKLAERLGPLIDTTTWLTSSLKKMNELSGAESDAPAALAHAEGLVAWLIDNQAQQSSGAGQKVEA